ncbi:hypothetical protein BH10PSE10_BH10PSE10_03240 [soil metagenome]
MHAIDGDLPDPKLPIIPGHEIVGIVDMLGSGVATHAIGARRHSVAGPHLQHMLLLRGK